MPDLTLLDLVSNRTMDARTAATLWALAEEKHSFMVVAVPRLAGKSTVSRAMLQCVPGDVPQHFLSGDEAEMEQFRQAPDDGYLVVGEFSQALVPTYIWGSPVRKVFETLRAGFSLAVSLHAPTVEAAYDAVCRGNVVADEDASRIRYVVYIELRGTNPDDFVRRVARVHEVGPSGGRRTPSSPAASLGRGRRPVRAGGGGPIARHRRRGAGKPGPPHSGGGGRGPDHRG